MKVRFLSLAQSEVDDAVAWYNNQADGLGLDFLDELDRSLRRALEYPLACPEIVSGLRRCLFARFPFGLIYGMENDSIVIVAVAHLHREPRYWADRLR